MTKRHRGQRAAAKRERRRQRRERERKQREREPNVRRVAGPIIATFDTRPAQGRLRLRAPKSMHPSNPDFLARNLEIGFLVQELTVLREHNKSFTQDDPQQTLLMFSEGALVLVAMERFLRVILGSEVAPGQTLPNLLELVFSERLDLLDPPGGDRAYVTKLVVDIRNALLHANFEQAAQQAGAKDVRDYFRNHYARELELLYSILNTMMAQIDPATGRRYETQERQTRAREGFVRVVAARSRKLARAKARKTSRPSASRRATSTR